jgi:putative redox protein
MAKSVVKLLKSDSFYSEITSGKHQLYSDEPISSGGTDKAPDPIELTLSALGACTVMTLKMYLDQKKWAFSSLSAEVETTVERILNAAPLPDSERKLVFNGRLRRINVTVTISGSFGDDQLRKIEEISGKCPVNRMLAKGAYITEKVVLNE